ALARPGDRPHEAEHPPGRRALQVIRPALRRAPRPSPGSREGLGNGIVRSKPTVSITPRVVAAGVPAFVAAPTMCGARGQKAHEARRDLVRLDLAQVEAVPVDRVDHLWVVVCFVRKHGTGLTTQSRPWRSSCWWPKLSEGPRRLAAGGAEARPPGRSGSAAAGGPAVVREQAVERVGIHRP